MFTSMFYINPNIPQETEYAYLNSAESQGHQNSIRGPQGVTGPIQSDVSPIPFNNIEALVDRMNGISQACKNALKRKFPSMKLYDCKSLNDSLDQVAENIRLKSATSKHPFIPGETRHISNILLIRLGSISKQGGSKIQSKKSCNGCPESLICFWIIRAFKGWTKGQEMTMGVLHIAALQSFYLTSIPGAGSVCKQRCGIFARKHIQKTRMGLLYRTPTSSHLNLHTGSANSL